MYYHLREFTIHVGKDELRPGHYRAVGFSEESCIFIGPIISHHFESFDQFLARVQPVFEQEVPHA